MLDDMRVGTKTVVTLLFSWISLSVCVLMNYKLGLAWLNGDNRNWPLVLATVIFLSGLAWCLHDSRLTPLRRVFLVLGSLALYLFVGFFVLLFSACAMGDCL
jgi:hypothetical protein